MGYSTCLLWPTFTYHPQQWWLYLYYLVEQSFINWYYCTIIIITIYITNHLLIILLLFYLLIIFYIIIIQHGELMRLSRRSSSFNVAESHWPWLALHGSERLQYILCKFF